MLPDRVRTSPVKRHTHIVRGVLKTACRQYVTRQGENFTYYKTHSVRSVENSAVNFFRVSQPNTPYLQTFEEAATNFQNKCSGNGVT